MLFMAEYDAFYNFLHISLDMSISMRVVLVRNIELYILCIISQRGNAMCSSNIFLK